VIYAPAVTAVLRVVDVRAVAHITGGGIPGNLARVLPAGVDAVVERRSWEVPRMFGEIQRLGRVADDEMAKVFNLGLGMIMVVPPDDEFRALDVLRSHGHQANVIGRIERGDGAVRLV
jgi:phosphoribosylformylglycinamidine cyclo-ligase